MYYILEVFQIIVKNDYKMHIEFLNNTFYDIEGSLENI